MSHTCILILIALVKMYRFMLHWLRFTDSCNHFFSGHIVTWVHAYNFVFHRASKVCKLWYAVASDKSLWHSANLSGNIVRKFKKNFRWLVRYRLPPVRFLNLANWEVLTYKEIEVYLCIFIVNDECRCTFYIKMDICLQITTHYRVLGEHIFFMESGHPVMF